MGNFVNTIASVNDTINGIVWGVPAMILIMGVGLYLTIRCGALQFTKLGYSVDSCFDGESVFDFIKLADYDAIVMDVMMPEKDGFTVLKDNNCLDTDKEIIEQYQNTIVKQSSKYAMITKEELAWELYKMDDWTKKHNRNFIGLKYFVVNILGLKGYDISTSYEMIKLLETDGYIETYLYDKGESASGINPTAIRIVKPLAEVYNITKE